MFSKRPEKPEISVIIPTYNGEKTLRYTLQTVLNQTFENFEVLVVGDGSTDRSEEVVQSMEDSRFSWFNLEKNSGSQPAPNNQGLKLSRGEYIAYLGHDDLWFPDHLEKCLGFIKEHQLELTYSLIASIFPGPDNRLSVFGYDGKDENKIQFVSPTSWMHLRKLVQKAGKWKEDYMSSIHPPDMEYFIRLQQASTKSALLRELTVIKFGSQHFKSYSKDDLIKNTLGDYSNRMSQDHNKLRYEVLNMVALELSRNHPRLHVSLKRGIRMIIHYFTHNAKLKFGNHPAFRWFFIWSNRRWRKSFNKKRGLG